MKNVFSLIITMLVSSACLFSQVSTEEVLKEVEFNNTTLAALRKTLDARKIGNKTGIYLQDPEIEFAYLWGNPSDNGNRVDFSVMQRFDFPTAYGYKNQLSDLMNEQAELEYQKQLKSIMLQAKSTCFDLIFLNAMRNEYSKRLGYARNIAELYKKRFETGDIGILEYNKAKLNLLNSGKKLESIEIERSLLMYELIALNGGQSIDFTDSVFDPVTIPENFEEWYILAENKNPSLQWLLTEIKISRKQIDLSQALNLPRLDAGYKSETIVNQDFKGISAGISIPLWENKNKIKYARASSFASESISNDYKIQFYNNLKALHAKSVALKHSVDDYKEELLLIDDTDLLKKAFDKGEVSLLDFIMSLSIYYESITSLFELERDLNKTFAELNKYI